MPTQTWIAVHFSCLEGASGFFDPFPLRKNVSRNYRFWSSLDWSFRALLIIIQGFYLFPFLFFPYKLLSRLWGAIVSPCRIPLRTDSFHSSKRLWKLLGYKDLTFRSLYNIWMGIFRVLGPSYVIYLLRKISFLQLFLAAFCFTASI